MSLIKKSNFHCIIKATEGNKRNNGNRNGRKELTSIYYRKKFWIKFCGMGEQSRNHIYALERDLYNGQFCSTNDFQFEVCKKNVIHDGELFYF